MKGKKVCHVYNLAKGSIAMLQMYNKSESRLVHRAVIFTLDFFSGLNPSKTKLELQRHLATLDNQEQASVFETAMVMYLFLSVHLPFPPATRNNLVCSFYKRTSWLNHCVITCFTFVIFKQYLNYSANVCLCWCLSLSSTLSVFRSIHRSGFVRICTHCNINQCTVNVDLLEVCQGEMPLNIFQWFCWHLLVM